jgi:hypothetical protein
MSDEDLVVLSDGRASLTFAAPEGSGGIVEYLTVRMEGPDLAATRRVYGGYAGGFADLGDYFADLSAHWRGWTDEKDYESCEHDLRISAKHDGGHITLRVLLWESTQPLGWRVETAIRIEPGEQLSQAARSIADLVKPTR